MVSQAFCCTGCEQVYGLIQAGGLDGYYELQDRQGQPVGDRAMLQGDFDWADCLQAKVEAQSSGKVAHMSFSLNGMTCLGCVWLVERLGRRCPGLITVNVSLERQCLELEWQAGEFTVSRFLLELRYFGYRAEPAVGGHDASMSALAWRSLLTLVFALNGLFLSAPQYFDVNIVHYVGLIQLLLLLFCILSFVVGGGYFVLPACRALRQKKLHYDLLPALGLSLAWLGCVWEFLLGAASGYAACHFLLLCALSLVLRWLLSCRWERAAASISAAPLQPWAFRWIRSYTFFVLLLAVCLTVSYGLATTVSLLLLSNIYPIARSIGAGLSRQAAASYFALLGIAALSLSLGAWWAVLVTGLLGWLWSSVWLHLQVGKS